MGVKLLAGAGPKPTTGFLLGEGSTIRSIAGHSIIRIRHCDDPSLQGDVQSPQPIWIQVNATDEPQVSSNQGVARLETNAPRLIAK